MGDLTCPACDLISGKRPVAGGVVWRGGGFALHALDGERLDEWGNRGGDPGSTILALGLAIDANSLEAAIAIEDRNQILCSRSEDFNEGIRAFLEKRKPVYIRR